MIEKLVIFGDQIRTKMRINGDDFVAWTEDNFDYIPYNPRKDIPRYGLSVTSLDGGLSGIPDIDSLREYNSIHGTSYTEKDFQKKTKVFEYPGVKDLIKPWSDSLYRSHVLKLESGGYFPPHRDNWTINPRYFRLIAPLKHCNPPEVIFSIEDRILNWNVGDLYFINTLKVHTLFNASPTPSYWLIFNVAVTEVNIEKVLERLRFR